MVNDSFSKGIGQVDGILGNATDYMFGGTYSGQ